MFADIHNSLIRIQSRTACSVVGPDGYMGEADYSVNASSGDTLLASGCRAAVALIASDEVTVGDCTGRARCLHRTAFSLVRTGVSQGGRHPRRRVCGSSAALDEYSCEGRAERPWDAECSGGGRVWGALTLGDLF